MTKKRKSGGRAGGSKGSTGSISCSNCGTLVPKDKAKKKTGRITLVEPTLAKNFAQQELILQLKKLPNIIVFPVQYIMA